MHRYMNVATIVVALSWFGTGAARAADFHPEDAACQWPCAVQDAGSKTESAAPLPAPRQPAPSKVAARKAGKPRAVEVAQHGNVDGQA